MRRFAFAVALFAFTCHTAAQQSDPKKKPDLELIRGTWSIVGLESGGKNQTKGLAGNTFTFGRDKKGGDVAILKEAFYQEVDFTYSLDP